ncbi:unnamed protein product, partial [Penicillium pancosmium]
RCLDCFDVGHDITDMVTRRILLAGQTAPDYAAPAAARSENKNDMFDCGRLDRDPRDGNLDGWLGTNLIRQRHADEQERKRIANAFYVLRMGILVLIYTRAELLWM